MALLSHRQGWWLAVLLCLFPCLFSASNTSDTPAATYRSGASEVRIAFFATDENGTVVQILNRDDFAVVDNEIVVRDFRSLTPVAETPLDVVLLVDTSQSVAPRFRETVENVRRLSEAMPLSSSDELSVIAFSGVRSRILCSGNCRSEEARESIRALRAENNTPLYDAMTEVAEILAARRKPDVRQIIVLFSDGNDTISRASDREALSAIIATGAVLYGVSSDASSDNTRIEKLAEATGGRLLLWNSDKMVDQILAEQRASYIVSYALPSREKGFHSLRILPKHNLNLQFHCRRGYYYDEVR